MLASTLKLSLIAIIILVIVAIPSQYLFNDPSFQQQLSARLPKGLIGAVFLLLFLAGLTAVGLPRQIAAFISGFSFGTGYGFIIALIATTIGCYLTLVVARRFLTAYIDKNYPRQQSSIASFLAQQLFYKAIIIRILPLGSNFLTNIIAGVCRLDKTRYVAGSFIGFIPQIFIFSLAGAGIKLASSSHLMISASLFVLALIGGAILYQSQKSAHQH
ncbi:MAG: TVP38/TMEM64 family protein [Thalassotalea sp.]